MSNVVLIDTNLYLDDANIINKLSVNDGIILIPITVLKELDKHKYDKDLSYSARNAIQAILEFTTSNKDKTLFDIDNYNEFKEPDLKIIASAKKHNAKLATKDISMSIIADSMGLETVLHDIVLNNIFNPYIYMTMEELYKETDDDVFSYDSEYNGEEYDYMLNIFSSIAKRELSKDGWWFAMINVGTPNVVIYANNPITNSLLRIDNKPKYRKFKNDKGINVKALDDYQICAIYAMVEAPNALICGSYGSGKSLLATTYAITSNDKKTFISRPNLTVDRRFELGFLPGPQPLCAKILTPIGWSTMGEIKKGDYVIGQDGKPAKVLETFDKGNKGVYKVSTTNGGSTMACGDHVWATKTHNELKHNKNFGLRTTKEIENTLLNPNTGPAYNHTLPMNNVVEYDDNASLSIPPYTLGVLIGDGSLSNSISFTSVDEEIVNRVSDEMEEYGIRLSKNGISYSMRGCYYSNKPAKPVKITNLISKEYKIYNSISDAGASINIDKRTVGARCKNNRVIDNNKYAFLSAKRWKNYVKNALSELNLLGTYSYDKFIPSTYKYTSIENRVALLQGLMDTDGTIKESTGEQIFTTTSERLAVDVMELARSLGMNATYYTRNRIGKTTIRPENGGEIVSRHISYEVSIPKSNEIDVFYLERKLNRSKTPTRNKHIKIKSVEYVGEMPVKCLLINNDSHLYITDDFIVTHNTMTDKLSPWMAGFVSSLYHIFSNTKGQMSDKMSDSYDFVKETMFKKYFEMMPLDTLQGMSFMDGDLLLLDEAQLCSISILATILSRFGKGSKLIMTGDINQVYNVIKPSENGLLKLLRLLPSKHMAYVELKNNYRSELLELAADLQDKTF